MPLWGWYPQTTLLKEEPVVTALWKEESEARAEVKSADHAQGKERAAVEQHRDWKTFN